MRRALDMQSRGGVYWASDLQNGGGGGARGCAKGWALVPWHTVRQARVVAVAVRRGRAFWFWGVVVADGWRMVSVAGIEVGLVAGAAVFGTVLTYADLPEVRAWRAGAQLDIAGVFAMRKSEPALSVLFSELSTG